MTFILITGSEGLIGRSLQTLLHSQGFACRRFDIRISPTQNILDPEALRFDAQGCRGIIHLAGTSRVLFGQQDPLLCLQQNIDGTHNVIQVALESLHKPWLIYASSREVYGQQDSLPVEEDAPLKPTNIYAYSKKAAEEKVIEAQKAGLQTSILRFSNVFGDPFDYPDRVIPAFCRAALLGESLYVEGATNTFDFTYVSDVVRGIHNVIKLFTQERQSLPPIHFTSGRGITLQDAATLILQKAQSHSSLLESSPRSFDVAHFVGNPRRAQERLGWSPVYSFESAILQLLSLLRSHINTQGLLPRKASLCAF